MKNNKRYKTTIIGSEKTINHPKVGRHLAENVKTGKYIVEDQELRCLYINDSTIDMDQFRIASINDPTALVDKSHDMSFVIDGLTFDDLIQKLYDCPKHWNARFLHESNKNKS